MEQNNSSEVLTLRDLIRRSGMTQTQFAEKVGVSVSQIHNYSKGDKDPTLTPFLNMCRELKQSPVELAKALGKDVTGIPDDQ